MPIDWAYLKELRQTFLNPPDKFANYWKTPEQLESYDLTFAARIGWKWDAVLEDLKKRDWTPPGDFTLLDWGCGTGIAARTFLKHFPSQRVQFSDRCKQVEQFAIEKAGQGESWDGIFQPNTVLLLSHVLSETSPPQGWRECESVLCVEPGDKKNSQRLIQLRESTREKFSVWGPCLHQQACGLFGDEKDWCHFFAKPPGEIFHDRHWSEVGQKLGIDLRSLPVSFLALSKRTAPKNNGLRLLGQPRIYKGFGRLTLCEETEVSEKEFQKKHHPDLHKDLKKNNNRDWKILERSLKLK